VDITATDLYTGTQVNYYFICPTKLWLFSHRITMEQSSDLVGMGRFIHDTSYARERKDVIIDNCIGIDFIKRDNGITVHEVKKSKKLEKAHRYQLYYYLYYLKEIKGIPDVDGILDYPINRERVTLTLTDPIKQEITAILENIRNLIALPFPPEPKKKSYCRSCSYLEFCWV
jgi:CRISPR-associated exonuclease Cas4